MASKSKQYEYVITNQYEIRREDDADDVLTLLEKNWADEGSGTVKDESNKRKIRNYIKQLPWDSSPPPPVDVAKAKQELDSTHYGMNTVKNAVLEYLAVQNRNPSTSKILCLVSQPGCGKTSIFKSIAKALGRPAAVINCTGVDMAWQLSGSSGQWDGADIGEILKAIIKIQSFYGCILLDEIEKMGKTPSHYATAEAGLLNLLDDQRTRYTDGFLGVPVDLSNVVFIATANNEAAIHPTLRDRMHVIRLGAYTFDEKVAIIKRYIVPKLYDQYRIKRGEIEINDTAIKAIVEASSAEAGVRKIKQISESAFAKALYIISSNKALPLPFIITKEHIKAVLVDSSIKTSQSMGF